MSFADILATGSGQMGARVSIEGMGTEFVSDPSMEGITSDGRRRVCCLSLRESEITIADAVNIPEAMLEADAVSISIYETEDQDISRALAYRPDLTRYLEETAEIADTQLTLSSTLGISAGDVVHIGTEAILVDSVVSSTILDVTGGRGHWDTIPQKHWSNLPEINIELRAIYNRPLSVRGRRVRVYLYGQGDDPTGDGTQAWLGQVTSGPRCDEHGLVWYLQIGSIAERLEQKFGGDLEQEIRPRGIYYPWSAPLIVGVFETGSNNLGFTTMFTGFFETQQDFVEALTEQLQIRATASSMLSAYSATVLDDGTWTIQCLPHASVTGVQFSVRSPMDGQTLSISLIADVAGTTSYIPWNTVGAVSPARVWAQWVAGPPGARTVPRGYLGEQEPLDPSSVLSGQIETWPNARIYLAERVRDDWGALTIEWGDGEDPSEERFRIQTRSTTDHWVQSFLTPRPVGRGGGRAFTASMPLVAKAVRVILDRGAAVSNVATLRDRLVDEGPEYANRGTAPFLTTADLADWTDEVEAAVGNVPWLMRRSLAASSPIEVTELLSHELRMAGLFPVIEPDGRVGVRRIEIPNAALFDATDIDDEIIGVAWSNMERGGQTINRVRLNLNYDHVEDEWARHMDFVEMESYAQEHLDHALEIEPRSKSAATSDDSDVLWYEAQRVFRPLLATFGFPHDFVTIQVSWKLFPLTIGSVVRVSAIHLPDYDTGVRPAIDIPGIVVGRRWVLGEPHGELRVLLSWLRTTGYAPSARIVDQTNVSGNTWDIELDPTMYAADGDSAWNHFHEDYAVRIVHYDNWDPTNRTAVVIGKPSEHVLRVELLSGSWAFSGDWTLELMFDAYATATIAQRRYAGVADRDLTLGDGEPWTFAP